MEFNENYINMCKGSQKIQELKKNGLRVGDYYLSNNTNEVSINFNPDSKQYKYWIPSLEQVYLLFPFVSNNRSKVEEISSVYFIKNKKRDYETINELFLAKFMYEQYKQVWDEEEMKWVETLPQKEKDMADTRTVSVVNEKGERVLRTEKIVYNYENGKIEVLEVVEEYIESNTGK